MLLKNAIAALTGLWGLSVHDAPIQPVDLRNLLSQKSNSWANGQLSPFQTALPSTTLQDAGAHSTPQPTLRPLAR